MDDREWIKSVTRFLSNHFGQEAVNFIGATNNVDLNTKEFEWSVRWDEYIASIYCGEDGKGVRIVSNSQDTHKRISTILNRVFKTMRPLEETWSLISMT